MIMGCYYPGVAGKIEEDCGVITVRALGARTVQDLDSRLRGNDNNIFD
jgi:hypothetical protein